MALGHALNNAQRPVAFLTYFSPVLPKGFSPEGKDGKSRHREGHRRGSQCGWCKAELLAWDPESRKGPRHGVGSLPPHHREVSPLVLTVPPHMDWRRHQLQVLQEKGSLTRWWHHRDVPTLRSPVHQSAAKGTNSATRTPTCLDGVLLQPA